MLADLTKELTEVITEVSDPVLNRLQKIDSAVKKKDLSSAVFGVALALDVLAKRFKPLKRAIDLTKDRINRADLDGDPQEPNWKPMNVASSDAVKLWKTAKHNTEAATARGVGEVIAALSDMLRAAGKRDPWIAGRDLRRLAAELETYALKLAKNK